jgi:hypothetical protein
MRRHFSSRIVILSVVGLILGGCMTKEPGGTRPGAGPGPTASTPSSPAPDVLRAGLAHQPLPQLVDASDVQAFVVAAGAAPVARREEIRAIIDGAHDNTEITKSLIREFEAAQTTDFSRALVLLSLIGEQRNPAGVAFLVDFVWQPLPKGGPVIEELGMSAEAEAMERLQVKAANAIPYARTEKALQAALEIAAKHPLKTVRIEAASSYLWNQRNSDQARRALAAVLRKDDLVVLDRPVHDTGMSAREFNSQIANYLDRHPELQPPAPRRTGRGKPGPATERTTLPPPPSESSSAALEKSQ